MGNTIEPVLVVIDGSALIHRAYHALPPFTAPDGTPTNALYGFIMMLLSIIDTLRPTYMVVCMDTPKPTFRKELLASYQSHRPKAPDELKVQFPLVKSFLEIAGIPVLLKEGFEADDVIGTVVHQVRESSPQVSLFVITGDRDLLQLVDDKVLVMMPTMGVNNMSRFNAEGVKKRLGVYPHQVIDYKALVGDSSDNYAGIPGIGPKTACGLLEKYETLERLYEHIDDIPARTKTLLVTHKESALLAKQLATIKRDVEVEVSLSKLVCTGVNKDPVIPFLDTYGLYSIKKRLETKVDMDFGKKEPSKKDKDQLSFFS